MNIKKYFSGLEHIGIPGKDIKKTVEFYEKLGFETFYEATMNGTQHFAFLKLGDLVIETYDKPPFADAAGVVDHYAIKVTDVDAVFEKMKDEGYDLLDKEVQQVPFFGNGYRYFMIKGPNGEKIEFGQSL